MNNAVTGVFPIASAKKGEPVRLCKSIKILMKHLERQRKRCKQEAEPLNNLLVMTTL